MRHPGQPLYPFALMRLQAEARGMFHAGVSNSEGGFWNYLTSQFWGWYDVSWSTADIKVIAEDLADEASANHAVCHAYGSKRSASRIGVKTALALTRPLNGYIGTPPQAKHVPGSPIASSGRRRLQRPNRVKRIRPWTVRTTAGRVSAANA